MEMSLVSKFLGPCLNIDLVYPLSLKKWYTKGQVDVIAMEKGFLSFSFTCEDDLLDVLTGGLGLLANILLL